MVLQCLLQASEGVLPRLHQDGHHGRQLGVLQPGDETVYVRKITGMSHDTLEEEKQPLKKRVRKLYWIAELELSLLFNVNFIIFI